MPLPTLTHLPRLDAQLLLAHVLGKGRAWVLAHPETTLDSIQQARLEAALAQLAAGVPLPYVLGHWEFYGLDFELTSQVLIPRPETELLVETALKWLDAHPAVSFAVDVGTGSGCIAVTIAVHSPHLHLLVMDRSLPALQVARRNAHKHGVASRIEFVQSDLLTPFDFMGGINTLTPNPSPKGRGENSAPLLLANLPYIPSETLHFLEVYGREPSMALDGGPDGLTLIRRLLAQAVNSLAHGGLALLEIEASQGAAAQALARQYFPRAAIQVLPDLAGLDRLLTIQLPEER